MGWRSEAFSTDRDRGNQRRVALWSLAWAFAYVVSSLGIAKGIIGSGAAAVGASMLTAALGLCTLAAYWRFLRGADELHRKIELEALAVAFGAGLVAGVATHLLQRSGDISELGPTVVLMVMFVTYIGGVLLGYRRYR